MYQIVLVGDYVNENKTIAAISSAAVPSGIGVIRVSGKDAFSICDKVFRGKVPLSEKKGYTLSFGSLYNKKGEFIDETVAAVFRSPKSYTGEDTVEFSCHGSPVLLREALRALIDAGCVSAGKGEFTKRALLSGKLSLTEAEAVIDIINAESFMSAKCAFSNKNGALFRRIEKAEEEILYLSGEVSAIIDFPDEDLCDISKDELGERLNSALDELHGISDTFFKGQLIKNGIPTVIVGKPNVGKSSLMNMLTGTERSIVTSVPGTTRDIVESSALLGDTILLLSDTAGIHDTSDEVEKIGVQRARERLMGAEIVLAVFDGSEPLTAEDTEIIEKTKVLNTIAVINKSDKGLCGAADDIKKVFGKTVEISAKDKAGEKELEAAIIEKAGLSDFSIDAGIIANDRQYDAISEATRCLEDAVGAFNMGSTFDIIGMMLEEVISALASLTGERASDKIIDNVFSRFCVGK